MRKAFLFGIVALLLAALTFGVAAQEPVTIDFYFPTAVDGPISDILQGYADQFMEQNPHITVNVVYTGDYNQTRDTIQTEISSGSVTVDVAVMLAIDLFSFIEEESILPLQPFIEELEEPQAFVSDFFPAFWTNSVDEEGTIWSLPFQRSTPILFYNADLLAEAGLEVPKNNEELVAVAQALTTEERDGLQVAIAGIFPSWLYQSFAAAYGQPLVGEDPAQVYLNTPQGLAALEFVTRLGMPVEEGGYAVGPMGGSAWGDTPAAFTSGQAAMIYHTTGSLTSILENAPFEVGVAFLPSGPAGGNGTGYGAPTGGGNLYLFASSTPAEQQAAWLWAQYLASPEIQADWGAKTGYIAARESAWELEPLASLVEEYPQYAVARDQLDYAVKEFSAYRTIDLQNIINTELSRVISGEVPLAQAAEVLANAQAQIDSLLAEYQ